MSEEKKKWAYPAATRKEGPIKLGREVLAPGTLAANLAMVRNPKRESFLSVSLALLKQTFGMA
jgi:hypothetical protein